MAFFETLHAFSGFSALGCARKRSIMRKWMMALQQSRVYMLRNINSYIGQVFLKNLFDVGNGAI